VNQLVGYLALGRSDIHYEPQKCRGNIIRKVERDEIIEELVRII